MIEVYDIGDGMAAVVVNGMVAGVGPVTDWRAMCLVYSEALAGLLLRACADCGCQRVGVA
jgi:hypothetical protein